MFACARDDDGKPPPADSDTSETAGTASTAESGPVAHTGDTEIVWTPEVPPACTGQPPGCVNLRGDHRGDQVGRAIDVGVVDGRPLLVIGEPSDNSEASLGAVHVFSEPPRASTTLRRGSQFRIEADQYGNVLFGAAVELVPSTAELVYTVYYADQAAEAYRGPFRGTHVRYEASGSISPRDAAFRVDYDMGPCVGSDGVERACLPAPDFDVDPNDQAGHIALFDVPLEGRVSVRQARTRLHGDPFDRAQSFDGANDLDGDGIRDLLVGAYAAGPGGKLAVVPAPPAGVHRVWDLAISTVTGTIPGGSLGMNVNTGDVNGDGTADLLTTANFGDPQEAYVFFGPLALGDQTAGPSADWTLSMPSGGLGWDLVTGDFDGDGTADLAAGAPFRDGPGEVRVWTSPTPGRHGWDSATAVLQSGVGVEDQFGFELEVGDLDLDGRSDLVIGAPLDPQGGFRSGSVTIFYGGGL